MYKKERPCQLNFEWQTFRKCQGWSTQHDFCPNWQSRWVVTSCRKHTMSLTFWADFRTCFQLLCVNIHHFPCQRFFFLKKLPASGSIFDHFHKPPVIFCCMNIGTLKYIKRKNRSSDLKKNNNTKLFILASQILLSTLCSTFWTKRWENWGFVFPDRKI